MKTNDVMEVKLKNGETWIVVSKENELTIVDSEGVVVHKSNGLGIAGQHLAAAIQSYQIASERLRDIREIISDKGYSHMPSGFFTSAVTRVNDVLKRCEREKLI